MILYIKHIDIEGAETLGEFFESKGFNSQTVEMGVNENLPESFDEIEAVVVLGGPMNVYEEDEHPFLAKENKFIQDVLQREIPYMGLCLGSQLLAKAAGAKVVRSPVEEIGWFTVDITNKGRQDPLFYGIEKGFDVFHWHGDMFEIPEEGQLIATSSGCPNQAFKVGANAYGLQFHVEINDQSIEAWADRYYDLKGKNNTNIELTSKKEEMIKTYFQKKEKFDSTAETLYENFHQIILNYKKENAQL